MAHDIEFNEELPTLIDSDSDSDENIATPELPTNLIVVPTPTTVEILMTSSTQTTAATPEPL